MMWGCSKKWMHLSDVGRIMVEWGTCGRKMFVDTPRIIQDEETEGGGAKSVMDGSAFVIRVFKKSQNSLFDNTEWRRRMRHETRQLKSVSRIRGLLFMISATLISNGRRDDKNSILDGVRMRVGGSMSRGRTLSQPEWRSRSKRRRNETIVRWCQHTPP